MVAAAGKFRLNGSVGRDDEKESFAESIAWAPAPERLKYKMITKRYNLFLTHILLTTFIESVKANLTGQAPPQVTKRKLFFYYDFVLTSSRLASGTGIVCFRKKTLFSQ